MIKEIVCVLKLLVVTFFKINNDVSLEQCEIDPYLESILTVIYNLLKLSSKVRYSSSKLIKKRQELRLYNVSNM